MMGLLGTNAYLAASGSIDNNHIQNWTVNYPAKRPLKILLAGRRYLEFRKDIRYLKLSCKDVLVLSSTR